MDQSSCVLCRAGRPTLLSGFLCSMHQRAYAICGSFVDRTRRTVFPAGIIAYLPWSHFLLATIRRADETTVYTSGANSRAWLVPEVEHIMANPGRVGCRRQW